MPAPERVSHWTAQNYPKPTIDPVSLPTTSLLTQVTTHPHRNGFPTAASGYPPNTTFPHPPTSSNSSNMSNHNSYDLTSGTRPCLELVLSHSWFLLVSRIQLGYMQAGPEVNRGPLRDRAVRNKRQDPYPSSSRLGASQTSHNLPSVS